MRGLGKVKIKENKVTKSAENMKFHVAESFLFNFGAAGEILGLIIVKQFKKGLKRSKTAIKGHKNYRHLHILLEKL